MIATSFHQSNMILDIPQGSTTEECEVLSAWQGVTEEGQSITITCWKPTQRELEQIQKTGRVWLLIKGHHVPPVHVCGMNPFDLSQPSCSEP